MVGLFLENFRVQTLDMKDFDQIESLVLNRKRFLNKPVNLEVNQKYLSTLKSMLQDYPNNFVLNGCYDENDKKLCCFAGSFEHTGTPTWSLLYVTNSKVEFKNNGPMSLVLKNHLDYFENKKIYRFVYAAPVRGLSVYNSIGFSSLLTRICPEMERYDFFTAEKISSGNTSKFALHQKLLGSTNNTTDMVVRYAELKEKYRKIFSY